MSRSGRYASNIRKVASIAGTKTVEKSECGTIFVVDGGGYDITLPKLADVPNGWWCQFGVGTSGSTNVNVKAHADNSTSLVGIISPIDNTGSFVGGVTNTAYVLAHGQVTFRYADFTAQVDGLYSMIDCTKISATNWRVEARCFKAGFITGSAV